MLEREHDGRRHVYAAVARLAVDDVDPNGVASPRWVDELEPPLAGGRQAEVWNLSSADGYVGVAPGWLPAEGVRSWRGASYGPPSFRDDPVGLGGPTLVFSPRGGLAEVPASAGASTWIHVVDVVNKTRRGGEDRYAIWIDRGGTPMVTQGPPPAE